MRIGVLALQGDVAEHIGALERLGIDAVRVRLPTHLEGLDGLIMPGGESTTIGKLVGAAGLMEPLRKFAEARAVWGTCAGAILLARQVDQEQPLLGVMDIAVRRNAFGSQLDSFECDLDVASLAPVVDADRPFHAIFIRAPVIESVTGTARVLAALPDGRFVAAQQGKLLATSFHPELTDDMRYHEYFVALADAGRNIATFQTAATVARPVR